MTEQEVANSAKIAEIRGRAEAKLDLAEWACDTLKPSDMDGISAANFALDLRAVARDVLALVEVAEAGQALIAEVPDGFDTGPGQDRVDAVFARLAEALQRLSDPSTLKLEEAK